MNIKINTVAILVLFISGCFLDDSNNEDIKTIDVDSHKSACHSLIQRPCLTSTDSDNTSFTDLYSDGEIEGFTFEFMNGKLYNQLI